MKEQDKPKVASAIRTILEAVEGRSLRPELLETPSRVIRALEEMLDGYSVDIDGLFKTSDDEGKDQIVVVRDITFTSWCEHHFLPWMGRAHIAYLPVTQVLGVSKIGRLVLAYAHRLQLQERLTKQVAYTLMEKLNPHGVAVIIIGEHTCMRCRGVRLSESQVMSSEMLGAFRQNAALRAEVLSLLGLGRR